MDGTRRIARTNPAIAALAEAQHGVVSREQLRKLGLGDSAVTARAASGYLRPLFRGTFAVGHGAIDRRGRIMAAALACDDGTIVSHGSAAELLGLWKVRASAIDVIPSGWSGREIDGVRWHGVRAPLADEIETLEGIRLTNVSRTIIDMAGVSGWGQLRRLVEQAAILRELDIEQIDLFLARGRRRGAPRLRRVLSPWRDTAEPRPRLRSRLEARLLPQLIEMGLPVPQTNVSLSLEGHRFEVDLLWKEQRLAIETDGEETHGTSAAFQRDRWRDQLLLAAGYRTARITWAQVQDEPLAVVTRIAHMLKAR
jgi:hypothetical protein